ncbi:TPA_asm: coat protein [ssRNA phage SRR7473382_4]|uniref:Coat protein n=1 Tax=ssRNA phage SRR7473382_4 TaxID=2786629 RepID=A0A8S5L4R7_9VIRU|nr:coat protein [ssRNA phage SRR7473382_4]DAD52335.1 TPA_asm: coat protein [ssRNA phage SRR7473382_4]
MTITVNTRVYTLDGNAENLAKYVGPAASSTVKDFMLLKRQPARPTADFAGVNRVTFKVVKTLTLQNSSVWDAIVEVNASIPVGATEADVDLIRDDVADGLLTANIDSLFWSQRIIG